MSSLCLMPLLFSVVCPKEDHSRCKYWNPSDCRYINVPPDCPYMCGLCKRGDYKPGRNFNSRLVEFKLAEIQNFKLNFCVTMTHIQCNFPTFFNKVRELEAKEQEVRELEAKELEVRKLETREQKVRELEVKELEVKGLEVRKLEAKEQADREQNQPNQQTCVSTGQELVIQSTTFKLVYLNKLSYYWDDNQFIFLFLCFS